MDITWLTSTLFWSTWTYNLTRIFFHHDFSALMQTAFLLWIIDNISDNKITIQDQPVLEHSFEIIHQSPDGLERLMKAKSALDVRDLATRLETVGGEQSSVVSDEILFEDSKQESEKLDLTKELVVDLHRTSWRNVFWRLRSEK